MTLMRLRQTCLEGLRQLQLQLGVAVKAEGPALASFLPGFMHRATSVVDAVLAASATLINSRPACTPWVVREPLLMLIHAWTRLYEGFLQIFWWGFQYNVLGNMGDHPKDPAVADVSYISSLLQQLDVLLERDAGASSRDLNEYASASVALEVARGHRADNVIGAHATTDRHLRPAASAGCSSDGHELLRRDTFDLWDLDYGLLRQLLREVLALQTSAGFPDPSAGLATIADLCGGGGHAAQFLDRTGVVAASAFGPSSTAPHLTADRVQHLDFLEELKEPLPADWALCLEAGARVPPAKADLLLLRLGEASTTGVVLSWPTSPACRPEGEAGEEEASLSYWTALGASVGLQLDEAASLRVRSQATRAENQRAALVFRKKSQPSQPRGTQHSTLGFAQGGHGAQAVAAVAGQRLSFVPAAPSTLQVSPSRIFEDARGALQRVLQEMRVPDLSRAPFH